LHFVTLFLGLLDPSAHRLEYVSAGHDPAIVLGAGDEVRELGATGLPAGMMPGATYQAGAIEIPPGGLVAVYSDGIREAMQGDEEIFGVERIAAGLTRRRRGALAEIADGIFADVSEFTGAATYEDDATLLLLRRG
jgi:sigma-B regulation protein RsbU (phosphoserine phosphatase)